MTACEVVAHAVAERLATAGAVAVHAELLGTGEGGAGGVGAGRTVAPVRDGLRRSPACSTTAEVEDGRMSARAVASGM